MNAKVELKEVRDWLRHQIRQINADPYLIEAHGRIEARIVKWDQRARRVLVCIRDRAHPETPYSSHHCVWAWVDTFNAKDGFYRWTLWKALNQVVVAARYPQLPF